MPDLPVPLPPVPPLVIRDRADITVTFGVIPPGSTVTFRRYSTPNCTGPFVSETVVVLAGVATTSVYSSPFTYNGGGMSYNAVFTPGNASVAGASSACEPLQQTEGCPAPLANVLLGDYNEGHVHQIFAGDPDDDGVPVPWQLWPRPVSNPSPQANGYYRRLVVKVADVLNDQQINCEVTFGPVTSHPRRFVTKTLIVPVNAPITFQGRQIGSEADLTMDLGIIGTNERAAMDGLGMVRIRGLEWHVLQKPLRRPSIYTEQINVSN